MIFIGCFFAFSHLSDKYDSNSQFCIVGELTVKGMYLAGFSQIVF